MASHKKGHVPANPVEFCRAKSDKIVPTSAPENYMQTCPTCGSKISPTAQSCASCGAPRRAATPSRPCLLIHPPCPGLQAAHIAPPSSGSAYQSSRYEGRFLPGTLIGGRYRIIALLGRGGMGEVYRADDLSLGQQVALKFLPEAAADEEMLERFRNEVRTARRISHPNVCRVFDIGQTEDQIFFSMEYIDGEDLGSLLRRIGRLPGDKAAEIARKICAGLAAAHSKGVLHRDLKPANVMLDGRGEVLIMDFGLAGLAHEIQDFCSGTPAYMAPEQLAGEEVTERSDIYSLGLVLYEVFTGKAAFDGRTLEEIVRVAERYRSRVDRPRWSRTSIPQSNESYCDVWRPLHPIAPTPRSQLRRPCRVAIHWQLRSLPAKRLRLN